MFRNAGLLSLSPTQLPLEPPASHKQQHNTAWVDALILRIPYDQGHGTGDTMPSSLSRGLHLAARRPELELETAGRCC